MSTVTKISDITSDYWTLSIEKVGGVVQADEEIAQSVKVILGTEKGSTPFMPDFGADILNAIDKPINEAAAVLRDEIIKQIRAYEPRIKRLRVSYKVIGNSEIKVSVAWSRFEVSQVSNIFETTYTI